MIQYKTKTIFLLIVIANSPGPKRLLYINCMFDTEQALGLNEEALHKVPLLGQGLEPVIHSLPPEPEVLY